MDTFTKLFGSLLAFVYHCFDRIVILGHLPLLTRPENMVHFFRDVHHAGAITKEVLQQRTREYNGWVGTFARNRRIPIEWAEKGVRKEDYVRSYLQRMERQNRFGVYFILKSMEVGPSFRSTVPRYPVEDPNYRIIARQRCRYTHYYFYIRDEVLGPISLCVGSFLPFQITYYLKNWVALTRYLDDGDLPIDNNHTERSLRGIAVGRNNWTFLGSDRGGKTMAILRSFVSSCELNQVNPFAWFRDVLARIPSYSIQKLDELLPHNWTAAQPA